MRNQDVVVEAVENWDHITADDTREAISWIKANSGNADPLRGWKMSAWEGGSRVPFIARWPGRIPAGWTSDEILTTMDLLPTFASIAGAQLPTAELDGKDAIDFLTKKSDASPQEEYFYYSKLSGHAYDPIPLSISLVKDERVVGGLTGQTNWDWLYIETLAVDVVLCKLSRGECSQTRLGTSS